MERDPAAGHPVIERGRQADVLRQLGRRVQPHLVLQERRGWLLEHLRGFDRGLEMLATDLESWTAFPQTDGDGWF